MSLEMLSFFLILLFLLSPVWLFLRVAFGIPVALILSLILITAISYKYNID